MTEIEFLAWVIQLLTLTASIFAAVFSFLQLMEVMYMRPFVENGYIIVPDRVILLRDIIAKECELATEIYQPEKNIQLFIKSGKTKECINRHIPKGAYKLPSVVFVNEEKCRGVAVLKKVFFKRFVYDAILLPGENINSEQNSINHKT